MFCDQKKNKLSGTGEFATISDKVPGSYELLKE